MSLITLPNMLFLFVYFNKKIIFSILDINVKNYIKVKKSKFISSNLFSLSNKTP